MRHVEADAHALVHDVAIGDARDAERGCLSDLFDLDGDARDDLAVRDVGCFGSFAPDRFSRVRIKAAVPVVAAPGGLAPDERSRRELVFRVRGQQPSEDELLGQFPATWQTVRFTDRSRIVDDGDCELLEQMAYSVFKPLGIEVVRGNNRCVPGQIRYGQLDFQIKALKAMPRPDDAK